MLFININIPLSYYIDSHIGISMYINISFDNAKNLDYVFQVFSFSIMLSIIATVYSFFFYLMYVIL